MNDLMIMHILDNMKNLPHHLSGGRFSVSFVCRVFPPNGSTVVGVMLHDNVDGLLVLVHIKDLNDLCVHERE